MTSEEAKKVYGDKHNKGYVRCDKCPVFDNCPEGRAGTGFGDCWEAIAENAPATADANVCENMLDRASIENANMAEKIEMLENCIDEQRKQIENQQGIIRGLEKRKEELCDYYEKLTYENGILKAQMEVVRMIFGGRNDA